MKFAWRHRVVDVAAWNSSEIEQVDLEEYKDFLTADVERDEHDLEAEVLMVDFFT